MRSMDKQQLLDLVREAPLNLREYAKEAVPKTRGHRNEERVPWKVRNSLYNVFKGAATITEIDLAAIKDLPILQDMRKRPAAPDLPPPPPAARLNALKRATRNILLKIRKHGQEPRGEEVLSLHADDLTRSIQYSLVKKALTDIAARNHATIDQLLELDNGETLSMEDVVDELLLESTLSDTTELSSSDLPQS